MYHKRSDTENTAKYNWFSVEQIVLHIHTVIAHHNIIITMCYIILKYNV